MTPIAHFDLTPCNTFGMTAHAAWGLSFRTLSELQQTVQDPRWRDLPRLVLGGGSNLLFTCDFAGLVLVNALQGIEVHEEADGWLLHVAAGENWHELVRWSLEQGMPGLENMALIPGSVGAAPVQNIGAYGVELCRYCRYVEAWDLDQQQLVRLPADECGFGYRESHFKQNWQHSRVITAVGLWLPKQWQAVIGYGPLRELGERATPQQIFDTICQLRLEKLPQPEQLGNAGSFFKNPTVPADRAAALRAQYPAMPAYPQPDGGVKLAAGWLIEQAGLKGLVMGRAAVHHQQALVLVNLGGAEAQEILSLARHVQQTVQQRFGIELSPEVRFMGARGEVTLAEVCPCAD
jgi:UDP-N-acetylmuramate dehydrogenase